VSDQGFGKDRRLRTGRDFGRVYHRHRRGRTRHLSLLLRARPRRGPKRARIGIVVSTKVSKSAVRRHQLKRWGREYFRCHLKETLHGNDAILVLHREPPPDHAVFDREVAKAVERALAAEEEPGRPRRRRGGGKG